MQIITHIHTYATDCSYGSQGAKCESKKIPGISKDFAFGGGCFVVLVCDIATIEAGLKMATCNCERMLETGIDSWVFPTALQIQKV